MAENIQKEVEIKDKKNIIFLILIIVLGIIACLVIACYDLIIEFEVNYIKSGLKIESITLEDKNINVKLKPSIISKDRWCQILKQDEEVDEKNWTKVFKNNCILEISEESKYVIIKDSKNQTEKIPIANYLNAIISLNIDKQKIILVEGETKEVQVNIGVIGTPDETLTFTSEDENILKTEGAVLTGESAGQTNLKITDKYNHELNIQVVVTNLITAPQITKSKEFLKAEIYTDEEANLLDEILESRVNTAGLKTRAGVVAAARFLTLEFKYTVPYFLENGRYQNTGFSAKIDGEGRYYHKGLYLSKDKYEHIKNSKTKPVMWGGILRECSTGKYLKNGLDCSGFVTWALYNGGYEPGDIGAGPGEWYTTLPDLGKSQRITVNLLKENVKAGDLIGWNGHIGIIIGIDDNNVYIADTIYYEKGLVATEYTHKGLVNSYFTHIYDMSEYYVEDGNYTPMW